MRGRTAVGVAAVAIGLLANGADSCSTSSSSNKSSDKASPSQSTTPKKQKKKVKAKTLYYSGVGDKNLGTVVVAADSTLTWNNGANSNFAITNDFNDENTISVNAIGTHDTSQIAAGTYHKVEVIGTNWTMKIVPNR